MQAICGIYAYDPERTPPNVAELTTARANLDRLNKEISIYGQEKSLRELVDALEQPVMVLQRTLELLKSGKVKCAPDFRGDWPTATAEYNLACFWSRYAGTAGIASDQGKCHTLKAVGLLRRTIGRREKALAEARVDPAFDSIRTTAGFQALMRGNAHRI
jgi:hypothetical protein